MQKDTKMIERVPTLICLSIMLIVLTIFYSFVGFFVGFLLFVLTILLFKNKGKFD